MQLLILDDNDDDDDDYNDGDRPQFSSEIFKNLAKNNDYEYLTSCPCSQNSTAMQNLALE